MDNATKKYQKIKLLLILIKLYQKSHMGLAVTLEQQESLKSLHFLSVLLFWIHSLEAVGVQGKAALLMGFQALLSVLEENIITWACFL